MDLSTGAGLIYVGIGYSSGIGIGKIGGHAMEAIARQPEQSGKLQTAMLIAAGLIEGAGLCYHFWCIYQVKDSKIILSSLAFGY
jgi:F-type H+-transporting ATPase subunit c